MSTMTNQNNPSPEEKAKIKPTGCCPPFTPSTWDNRTTVWKDKLFMQDTVRQLFHIPLNMGKVVTRMWEKIEAAHARPDDKDFLMLAYDHHH